MPKFLVLNRTAFERAVQAEVTADSAAEAVNAVPGDVTLGTRVIVLGASAGKNFTVVEETGDAEEVIVRQRPPVEEEPVEVPPAPEGPANVDSTE